MSTATGQASERHPRLPEQQPIKIEGDILFSGRREVLIVHKGEQYRLRITRQDKLILTK